jgi:DNA-directed RNA polymerase specialized sigma24 family protein
LDDIAAKTNVVMARFKVLANEEKRQSRRNEIIGRFKSAVMKAHGKFMPNSRCSFSTYADKFLVGELRHCLRHLAYVVAKENATVSCDRRIDGDEDDAPTFVAGLADPRDRFEEGIVKFDFDVVTEMLEKRNPLYASIFTLRRQGCKFKDIAAILGVPEWEMNDILWPAVRDAAREIYDHGC